MDLVQLFVFVSVVVCERRYVGQYRRPRGITSGTFSYKQLLFSESALNLHSIVFIANCVQRVRGFNKLRRHKAKYPVVYLKCPGNKPYGIRVVARKLQIDIRYPVDPNVNDLFRFYENAERVSNSNHQLEFGIKPFNIKAWIGFCKTQLLGCL